MSVSAFPYGAFSAAAASGGVVTLSGEAIDDEDASERAYRAALIIRTDGTVDKIENTSTSQIDASSDWIIPNSEASSDYQFSYSLSSGDALHSSTTMSAGAWQALSSDIYFEQRIDGCSVTEKTSTISVSVRKGTGSVLESGTYILSVERQG